MFSNVIPSSIVSKIICGVLFFTNPPGMSSLAHLHEGRRQVEGSQGVAGAKVQIKKLDIINVFRGSFVDVTAFLVIDNTNFAVTHLSLKKNLTLQSAQKKKANYSFTLAENIKLSKMRMFCYKILGRGQKIVDQVLVKTN